MNKKINSVAKDVINLEIRALQKLKSINNSFREAVIQLLSVNQKLFFVELVKVD